MLDADVRPQDVLTLADFVAVYSFFFGPSSYVKKSEITEVTSRSAMLSLSEIAIQTLQEERWRGTLEQVSCIKLKYSVISIF
jgi:hypothetical protein